MKTMNHYPTDAEIARVRAKQRKQRIANLIIGLVIAAAFALLVVHFVSSVSAGHERLEQDRMNLGFERLQ
jgi:large-conductance mechanosensitive channel